MSRRSSSYQISAEVVSDDEDFNNFLVQTYTNTLKKGGSYSSSAEEVDSDSELESEYDEWDEEEEEEEEEQELPPGWAVYDNGDGVKIRNLVLP